VDGSPYGPADKQSMDAFCQTLQKLGQNATVRRRLGADIDAACGQLRQRADRGSACNAQMVDC
jgi:23S rRNA (adenine2503-C2)-methyltransferase